ncbi:MAG: hypothetical protein KGZ66_11545 [Selenomonadales bacterium]|nr:hypothetical protein [Selenomonadales bacterium]
MKRNLVLVVAVVALVAVVVFAAMSFLRPETKAYATLQVNPQFEFAVDRDNQVINVVALSEDAKQVMSDLRLAGRDLTEALKLVTEKTIALGLVAPNMEFVFLLRPATVGVDVQMLKELATRAKESISASLLAANLNTEVKAAVISKEMFELWKGNRYLLEAYADLAEMNVSEAVIREILTLAEQGLVDKTKFEEELHTVVAAMTDMIEAGLNEEHALAFLRRALALDSELDELSTIAAALIDVHEAGGNPEHLLKFMEEALRNGVTQETMLAELTTVAAAYIDMVEAGLTPDVAKSLLAEAMKADPALLEVTTVVAAAIDMVEAGQTEAEAIAKIQAAIKADPSLDTLGERLGVSDKDADKAKDQADSAEDTEGGGE